MLPITVLTFISKSPPPPVVSTELGWGEILEMGELIVKITCSLTSVLVKFALHVYVDNIGYPD